MRQPVAYFTKEVNSSLAKQPLSINGSLSKPGLTFFSKIGHWLSNSVTYMCHQA